MAVDGSYLSSLAARGADPKHNLAAMNLALSVAIFIESPVFMLLSASTALSRDYQSFKKILNFTLIFSTLIFILMCLLAIPQVFYWVCDSILKSPPVIQPLAYDAYLFTLPWPILVGYRRTYQGFLIRHNLTRLVGVGTVLRLIILLLSGLILLYFKFPGATIATVSLLFAVTFEAICARVFADPLLKRLKTEHSTEEIISYAEIWSFYYPLALTAFISLGLQPALTFFMGRSRLPLESMAVLPVIGGLVQYFNSIGFSYQDAVIALSGREGEDFEALKKFALKLSAISFLLMIFITATPLSHLYFIKLSGLSEELAQLSIGPALIFSLIPLGFVFKFTMRGVLIKARITSALTISSVVEIGALTVCLLVLTQATNLVGIYAAAISSVVALISATIYLYIPYTKVVRSWVGTNRAI